MTNPTSNYNFQMPTATDLVTDLPADFEVFGQAVDTRLKALQPGTTLGDLAYSSATANTNTRLPVGTNGQVLAVVAGVPAWQNGTTGDIEGVTAGVGISGGGTSGTVTVTNSMATAITTNGDLIYGTGSGTFARLGIGTTGQVLNVAAGVPAWATPAGGGKVLQVIYGSTSSTVTSTSATFADTNLSASITPSSATSKVLVLVAQNGGAKFSADTSLSAKLVRGATDLVTFATSAGNTDNSNSNYFGTCSVNYLDSPATTSATTYKTQYANNGGGSVRFQASNASSQIILMEIGA